MIQIEGDGSEGYKGSMSIQNQKGCDALIAAIQEMKRQVFKE